jgi:exopolyphosphatase/guanosine-5'-triphosphate,3'-diphosphate pyrophosphatase
VAKAENAPGRLPEYAPVAIVDIGSNSIRLVIYDGARRSPTPVFNEKVLCGLGRGVATTGRMDDAAVGRALVALMRFKAVAEQFGAKKTYAIATAAAREADNGREFIRNARKALGAPIRVLTGRDEAMYTAMGVLSGNPEAEGIVGDLGGGSLELTVIRDGKMGDGITLPLGPQRLIDIAGANPRRAGAIIKEMLGELPLLDGLEGKAFYAVGGSWRNLARIQMAQDEYPLHVLHNYHIHRDAAEGLAHLVSRFSPASLRDIHEISENRAETLPYGALVLEELLRRTKVAEVVVSSYGLREGLLYSKLKPKARAQDPLLSAAWDLARLRSRSPKGAQELANWTDDLFTAAGIEETERERRLRRAACLVADIGWRADQDYRGEQSLNIVAHAAFAGIDHPGRAFLALTVMFRYQGLRGNAASPRLLELVDERALGRAKLIAAAQRLAYVLSGFMPGVLPKTVLAVGDKRVTLKLKRKLRNLHGEPVIKRLGDLARQLDRSPSVEMDD